MLERNRINTVDLRRPAALRSRMTSNIGTNQAYFDCMARREACDFTTLFKPAVGTSCSCRLNTIAEPMAIACSFVSDEGSRPTAAVGTGADEVAVVPSSRVQNRILGNYRDSLAGGGPGAQGGPGGAIALGGATHACAAKWRPGGRVPWQAGPPHGPRSSRIAAAY
jgi:hypothetical protein